MFSAMSISKEEMFLPSELAVDEVPSEVKNVCNLMNAIFYEAVAAQVGKLCKERCGDVKWTTLVKEDTTV